MPRLTRRSRKAHEGLLAEALGKGFLGRLSRPAADELVQRSTFVEYPAGAILVPVRASIVLSGLFAYVLLQPDGRQITIRYAAPGDLIGTLGSGAAAMTGAEAIEPSIVLQLEHDRLRTVASQHPELGLALVDELTSRLRAAYRTLASMSFGTVRSRVARDLITRARAGPGLREGTRLDLTQQELAQSVGSIREVVARALTELRESHIIGSRRSSITILDVTGLLREGSESPIEQHETTS